MLITQRSQVRSLQGALFCSSLEFSNKYITRQGPQWQSTVEPSVGQNWVGVYLLFIATLVYIYLSIYLHVRITCVISKYGNTDSSMYSKRIGEHVLLTGSDHQASPHEAGNLRLARIVHRPRLDLPQAPARTARQPAWQSELKSHCP